jgi:hypothetical protein
MPRAGNTAGCGCGCPGTPPSIVVHVGLAMVHMRWLVALNKIELALLILSAGLIAAGLLLLLETAPLLLLACCQ